MLIYFIKSILCLGVLWSFYKIFLENEKAHVFKRFYLLGSLLLSIILPLITFTYTSEAVVASETFVELQRSTVITEENNSSVYNTIIEYMPFVFATIYAIGVMIFSLRFVSNIRDIQRRISNNEKHPFSNYVLVLLRSSFDPHSFLSYIFLNKIEYESKHISEEIILHEKAHADQKHSLDILLMELVQIIFWFNPLLIWFKRSAKLNHEFLADEQVISEVNDASAYSEVLLKYAGGNHHVSLSSSINYSLTKKRIVMISKNFSLKKLLTRLGLFVPVLGCCIFLFNNEIVAKPALSNSADLKSEINSKRAIENVIQDRVLKIKVAGEKVWLNGRQTSLDNFAASVDKMTENWSENDLRGASIHMNTKDSDQRFLEKLNVEFSKTRISKVSGRDILPPPPPMPPSVDNIPPPPAPEVHASEMNEDARRLHNERAEQMRAMAEEQRILMKEEREKMREMREEIREDKKLTAEKRKKMIADVRRKETEMHRKMIQLEREQAKAERAQVQQERIQAETPMPPAPPAPPAPPKPEKVIDDINRDGGSFFYNGNKIDAAQAKKIARENKNINVRVTKLEDEPGKIEIFDN